MFGAEICVPRRVFTFQPLHTWILFHAMLAWHFFEFWYFHGFVKRRIRGLIEFWTLHVYSIQANACVGAT